MNEEPAASRVSVPESTAAQHIVDALAGANVLETFCRLPQADQENFSSWIIKARDESSHWRRIDALVLAMRLGTLRPDTGGRFLESGDTPSEIEDRDDALLSALKDSGVLDDLEITYDALRSARTPDLETLGIIHEVVIALRDAGVIETFFRLPRARQGDFFRWIGAIDDRDLRLHRTETFAAALQMAPLVGPVAQLGPEEGRPWSPPEESAEESVLMWKQAAELWEDIAQQRLEKIEDMRDQTPRTE
ncbi:MAG: hypothetical protein M3345_02760 [Actinomycetota bacterium]|nr:hypothetical protein [Actinomycetota bacterium]